MKIYGFCGTITFKKVIKYFEMKKKHKYILSIVLKIQYNIHKNILVNIFKEKYTLF